jgi:undecaprenyl-phosphate galactose phosphotransferase
VAALVNTLVYGRAVSNAFGSDEFIRLARFIAVAAGTVLWFENTGHYRVRMPFWLECQKVVTALAFAMLIDGFMQFAAKEDASRLWLMSGWLFTAVALLVGRTITRGTMRKRGTWQVPTLLVGDGATAEEARAAIRSEPGLGYQISAQVHNLPRALASVGNSWEQLCALHEADYIVIALDGKDLAEADQSIARLMRTDIPFSVSPPLRHLPVLGMTPQYFFNHDVMLLTRTDRLEQPLPRFIKRSFDIVSAGLALLLLSPILLIVAALVKMDGGPALFGHKRIGANGKSFGCLKFRSMVMNADTALQRYLAQNPQAQIEWQKDHKLRDDPRVTRLGKFLRRTSLDELPQLINVLRGDMSLVGPRPIVVAETKKYDSDIAYYYRVRPGLTGLWQVSGRNDVSYARRVRMDSWYVRNWSLWHDIAIICKTFPVLLNRSGAY